MNRRFPGSSLLAFLCVALGATPALAITAGALKCEDRIDPLGIDIAKPRFSWQVQSDTRAQSQTAYEVVVDGQWDSGKVSSAECLHVEYGGPALAAATAYTWKVRVWDASGQPSDWSAPAKFSTGLSDWSAAKWIGKDEIKDSAFFGVAKWIWYPEGNPASSAPVATRYFRRTLTLAAKPSKAIFSVAADNGFVLTINGVTAGSGNDFYNPTLLDVTALLNAGDNQITIAASNIGDAANPAGLIASLHADFSSSPSVDLVTDAQWSASQDGNTGWTTALAMGAYGISPWGTLNTRPLPARYLRREFQVDAGKTVSRATAYVCGMGFFDLSVNGAPASDHVMDPALSDYAKAAYYVTLDVTGQITSGVNAIGVNLGNGRFLAPRLSSPAPTVTYGFPKLLMELVVEYGDGTKTTVVSDANWKITDQGPIRSNNEYDGETYDARMEMPGWNAAGFNDSAWQTAALVAAPGGTLKSQIIEPMRFTQVIHPIGVTNPAPGTYIIDMGQSFYGTVRVRATGASGTTIKMVESYSLEADGTLKTADNRTALATDTYIMKGQGAEQWNPRFRGQGFRRIQVTGFPGVPTVNDFDGLVIHTDARKVGDFTCSNALINRIHIALDYGQRSFLRSAPLDPDRDERQSWMGDPAKDAESDAYNYNVAPFYTKWMDDVDRSERGDGTIPDVSMYWTGGSGVEWPSVFTIIPDWFTTFYDDQRLGTNHYTAIRTWVLAMHRYLQADGTLPATSYGDWCDTSTMDRGGAANSFVTPADMVSTAYHYNNCRIVQRLATARGNTADAQTFGAMGDALKTAFNAKYFNATTNMYSGDTQCGYVLAIKFGLVPDGKLDAVVSNLATNITVKNTGHLSVGLIGMQWLMQTLTDVGRSDLGWAIATQTSRPSWGYMLSKGSTTIWERWDGDTQGPSMNSEDLLILAGNLDAWFYQTLAGIRPVTPGFKTFAIKPEILGDLNFATAHFDSPYGPIVSDWKMDSSTHLSLACTVPANTTATVSIPLTKLSNATISEGGTVIWTNGSFASGVSGISYSGADATAARFVVGSGSYAFSVTGTAIVTPVTIDPVVVDDDASNVTYTGTWTRATDTEVSQRYGPSFRYASAGSGNATAIFRPTLPVAGTYQVSAWWTTNPNRATNTPFTIHSNSGDTTVACNQEINGGMWNSLGTFTFDAGTAGYVKLTNAANEYVIADAVQFVLISKTPPFQSWIKSYYPSSSDPTVIGPLADPDGDGVANLTEFALNGTPNSNSSRGLSFPFIAGDSSFEYAIACRRGASFASGSNGSQVATLTDDGIAYTVQGSQDLSFTNGHVEHLSTSNTGPTGSSLPDLSSSGWEYHLFRLTPAAGVPVKGFFRVRIDTP